LRSRECSKRQAKDRRTATDGDARTLAEIGQEFGISRERVRQIEAKTLAKLRSVRDSQKLCAVVD
jgi:RNA polymerase primary sigma factor